MDNQAEGLHRISRNRPVKVIAVCSGKGGVGKTNTATNIAVALSAISKKKICLLDANVSLANVDVLLGLQPSWNLAHVVSGEVSLDEAMLSGPQGLRIIPATSGNFDMADLDARGQAALVNAFSTLEPQPDILVVDTAAGISPLVARFVQAAQHPLVVVRDEPASLTDAYALIKVFSRNYGMHRFHIVTNQSGTAHAGRRLFGKLAKVTDTYLDVVLKHLGDVPQDSYLVKAVQQQRAVVDAYPHSPSGRAFLQLASRIDAMPSVTKAHGGLQFFLERLVLADSAYRGKVA
ncbi:MAG: MinD/ParA family protein [Pseudomonadota bacterium]